MTVHRRVPVVALLTAGALGPATSAAREQSAAPRRGCAKLFTVQMGERAARAIYSGTRRVTLRQLRLMGYIERCQRVPQAQAFVRAYDRRLGRAHTLRARAAAQPMSYAVASWYDDSGSTASGFHATYGVAVCGSGGGPCVPFGTRILICYHGRCVTATADDHGPYVAGRAFDLNQGTAGALGFSGVDTVAYRIGG